MDKEYWENYYEKHPSPFEHSDFAKYILKYVDADDKLIDLGCGNGRDSVFFGNMGINTIGVDQCGNMISDLGKYEHSKLKFIKGDMTSLPPLEMDYAYSRFTLHSITEADENELFNWVLNNVSKYMFIEVRSDRDKLAHEKTDHYRRFLNLNQLLKKMLNLNFEIVYAELDRGFSKYEAKFDVGYNENDPILIRIIAKMPN